MLVFSFIALVQLLNALGFNVDVVLFIRIALPLMFIVLGNYMGKVRFNYFVGIRTPWTLSSEEVWNRTHRLGAKLMVSGGLISLLGVFTSPKVGFIIVMSGILGPLLFLTIYSYYLSRKLLQ